MKIKYLGTAAYDAIPSPFCKCEICRRSKILGGRNIRTRSQALIDGDLLIDFNADTVMHFFKYGVDWDKIDNCLITHSHSDHFYPDDIVIPQYAKDFHKVDYFVAEDGYKKLLAAAGKNPCVLKEGKIGVNLVTPYQYFKAGAYTVLAVEATHEKSSSPVVYAIEKQGKRLLYCHDTGLLCEEAVAALKGFGTFNLISLDCTGAFITNSGGIGHMDVERDRRALAVFRENGIADENTVVVINHFSHNGAATYDDLVTAVGKDGFVVSYDGLEIEF